MSEERLNINQMRFVNLIVDYIVANGNIEDNKVLMGEPFKSVGSITTLFKDDMSTAKQIMEIVNQIKRNPKKLPRCIAKLFRYCRFMHMKHRKWKRM